MSENIKIELSNVSVDFPIYNTNSRSFKNKVLKISLGGQLQLASNNVVVVKGLKDINLRLQFGDRIGLVGHNGAGKSTLLRVLAGVYEPTNGEISVQGKVASLLNTNIGINPESTGRENIRLVGMMIGLTPEEIALNEQDIIEFTELGEYLDIPVRTYSSGMRLRLTFAICTCMKPDILLMDEWLGVGDAKFIDKAKARIDDLVKRTGILVLASHSAELLRRTCDKALWLEHGEIKAFADCDSVIKEYSSASKR